MSNETIHKRHSGIPENVNNSERMLKIFGESYERHEHKIVHYGRLWVPILKESQASLKGLAYLTQIDFGEMMVVTLWIDGFALEMEYRVSRTT